MVRGVLGCLLLGMAATTATMAQSQTVSDDGVRPAIDGATMPGAMPAAGMPEARRAPRVPAIKLRLPDARPLQQVIGTRDAGSFHPAGYVEDAPHGLVAGANWAPVRDGHVVAMELASNNAQALRVRLTGPFHHPLELRVYDPATGSAFGPYGLAHLRDHEEYWTTIIFGDQIGLEFFAPNGEAQPPPALPEINGIAYISELPGGAAAALGCTQRDASCESAWADSADAVVMMSTIDSMNNVAGFCNGTLLNRTPSDHSPLVATANHCLGTQAAANTTVYVWFYETASCNGTAPTQAQLNSLPRSNGSQMLKRHTESDYDLVGLYDRPPAGSRFLGWDAAVWFVLFSLPATGIHHPGGGFKRISFGEVTGETDDQEFCFPSGACFEADVYDIEYTTGFTQPGSSGSAVMDDLQRVRGTLAGGPLNDCTASSYGRFDRAFPNLRYYLFEPASPMFVDAAFAGDPGNNGSSERGTFVAPFNTVYEASFAVRAGDTVSIVPGNYNERFTIRRPMVLQQLGSSGTVVIGQ